MVPVLFVSVIPVAPDFGVKPYLPPVIVPVFVIVELLVTLLTLSVYPALSASIVPEFVRARLPLPL